MKASILTILILTLIINVIIAKDSVKKPNTELLGSWQHTTTYTLKNNSCYLKKENYLFYSDNSCKMETVTKHCSNGKMKNENLQLRWLIVNNYIVLLNENGKTERYFVGKGDIKNMLIGQKAITEFKSLDYDDSDKIFPDNLQSEQLCLHEIKP